MGKIRFGYFEIDKAIKEYHNLSNDIDKMVTEFVEVWNGLENKGIVIVDVGKIVDRGDLENGKHVKFEVFVKTK